MSLDFNNIPEGMLSGVDMEELEWRENESGERFFKEMDPAFIKMLDCVDESMPQDM